MQTILPNQLLVEMVIAIVIETCKTDEHTARRLQLRHSFVAGPH
jgi:hypothetical protein